jgi:fatty acid desaturase
MGISMFILLMSLGFSRRMDEHVLIAVMAAMLATSNATSSIILRWKMQFACAVVWWALTIFACFGHGNLLTIAFLAALFFCQIVFGIYLMIREARARREEAVHA